MFGGIHGDEWLGCEAVRQIVKRIDPEELSGTLVCVPVANPISYGTATRVTPGDGMNLNRVMPGTRDGGTLSEQLAAALCGILADGVTHFVDHHSAGNYATVDYSYMHENGAEMSRAFGCRYLYDHDTYPNTTTDFTLSRGIPSVVTEIGGGLHDTARWLGRYVDGSLNVMRQIGMLPGEVTPPPADQTIVTTIVTLRPRFGGMLEVEVTNDRLGESVPKGTVLGRIIDPYDFSELEVFYAPYDPTILILSRCPVTVTDPGDYAFMVADGATARPAN
jgi:predicted deacylase